MSEAFKKSRFLDVADKIVSYKYDGIEKLGILLDGLFRYPVCDCVEAGVWDSLCERRLSEARFEFSIKVCNCCHHVLEIIRCLQTNPEISSHAHVENMEDFSLKTYSHITVKFKFPAIYYAFEKEYKAHQEHMDNITMRYSELAKVMRGLEEFEKKMREGAFIIKSRSNPVNDITPDDEEVFERVKERQMRTESLPYEHPPFLDEPTEPEEDCNFIYLYSPNEITLKDMAFEIYRDRRVATESPKYIMEKDIMEQDACYAIDAAKTFQEVWNEKCGVKLNIIYNDTNNSDITWDCFQHPTEQSECFSKGDLTLEVNKMVLDRIATSPTQERIEILRDISNRLEALSVNDQVSELDRRTVLKPIVQTLEALFSEWQDRYQRGHGCRCCSQESEK